jgi:UDP-N-acetylmuramate: L-alanyl-gamma-D-glutamyl-meso-diaminopimelate ligase
VINNLEFDHADIFPDLEAIQRQFHHLVRTVPGNGLLVTNAADQNISHTLEMGCWTPVETFGSVAGSDARWQARNGSGDGSRFEVWCGEQHEGTVEWSLLGQHNVENALAVIVAARHAGVPPAQSIAALAQFRNVKRRLELRAQVGGIKVYDDFAHHPTAITLTLDGLRKHAGDARIIALLEPRSNTMRMGVHRDTLAPSLSGADRVMMYQAESLDWDLAQVTDALGDKADLYHDIDEMVRIVLAEARSGDYIIIMSNGAFGGIHDKLLQALQKK